MNRIDRISAILIQLQSKRTVKACDIADRFNISLRTVYRDIKTLEEAGVPLIGEAGVGYSLVEGYRLPPVMFTRDEAAAFLTAEKMVDKLTDNTNSASYRSAMFKIKAVLRSTDKDFIETIDNHIEVLKTRRNSQIDVNVSPLQTILRAIAEKRILYICYIAAYKEAETKRFIEPVGIFFLENYWHLIAYCQLRNDYRDFRFDRLNLLEITDQYFNSIHPPLQEHLKKLYKEDKLFKVVISVKKEAARFLGEQKYYNGFLSEQEEGDFVQMQFLTWSLEGFARWYITFADCARIIEPEAIKTRVKMLINKISENL